MAFFDFQYVGFGCGLSDVAKLFTCSVERDLLLFDDDEEEEDEGEDEEEGMAMGMGKGEERLLKHYQHILENVSGKKYSWEVLVMHWYVLFHFHFHFFFFFSCATALPTYHQKYMIRYNESVATNTSIHHRQTALIDWLRFQASWGKWICTLIYKVPGISQSRRRISNIHHRILGKYRMAGSSCKGNSQ